MKINERLAVLEKRQPDTTLARIRAMSDVELDHRVDSMTPDQQQVAQELLSIWLK